MLTMTWAELNNSSENQVIGALPLGQEKLRFVMDSREDVQGAVFFAIVGDTFDAHRFIAQVIEGGAVGIVVQRDRVDAEMMSLIRDSGVYAVITDDTLRHMQRTAAAYRDLLTGVIIGITGSCGKTTTKEMIAHAASGVMTVWKTPGNFNNHIGLPFSLLNTPHDAELVIIETGINHPGEMDLLASILRPDYVLFTNAGAAHLEGLDSTAVVISEKFKLIERQRAGGVAIVFSGIEGIRGLLGARDAVLVGYGEDDDVVIRNADHKRMTLMVGDELIEFTGL